MGFRLNYHKWIGQFETNDRTNQKATMQQGVEKRRIRLKKLLIKSHNEHFQALSVTATKEKGFSFPSLG
jgi:hypothetical protein